VHSNNFYLSGYVTKFLNFCVAYFPCWFLKMAVILSRSHFLHVAFVSILVFQTFDRIIFGTLTFPGTRWYVMTVRDPQMVRAQKKFGNHWAKRSWGKAEISNSIRFYFSNCTKKLAKTFIFLKTQQWARLRFERFLLWCNKFSESCLCFSRALIRVNSVEAQTLHQPGFLRSLEKFIWSGSMEKGNNFHDLIFWHAFS